ncbi:helix-turn-helix transcriptional regulator [Thermodesulfobacteriota bacterium]
MKNSKLKVKLFELKISQKVLSEQTGIPRPYLSLAIHGRYVLDFKQKQKIAGALGCQLQDIFQDSDENFSVQLD